LLLDYRPIGLSSSSSWSSSLLLGLVGAPRLMLRHVICHQGRMMITVVAVWRELAMRQWVGFWNGSENIRRTENETSGGGKSKMGAIIVGETVFLPW
jgi:hypothetical protein